MSRIESKPVSLSDTGRNIDSLVDQQRRRRRLITRWVLAGPVAFIVSVLIMASMPMWMPTGSGNVNHLAFSVLLFPAIWVAIVMYVLLEENMARASVLLVVMLFANGIPVALGVMKMVAAMQAGGGA